MSAVNASQLPEWFPVHVHGIPEGMRQVPTRGMILCAEWREEQLRTTISQEPWPLELGERLLRYLERWPLHCPTGWPECPVLFSVEGAEYFGKMKDLQRLRNAGMRVLQPYRTGVQSRYLSPFSGLTPEGECLLREMAALGMLLDLSHLQGPLLEHVRMQAPGRRIVSHVVCGNLQTRGIAARSNAMTDEELERCDAELYGVPFVDDLVSLEGLWEPDSRATSVELVARHVLHMASVVGSERVALGPDYQDTCSLEASYARIVPSLDQHEGLCRLWDCLRLGGLSEADVAGIFHANAWRVFFGAGT